MEKQKKMVKENPSIIPRNPRSWIVGWHTLQVFWGVGGGVKKRNQQGIKENNKKCEITVQEQKRRRTRGK